ncbi:MAG: hypothetical protein ACP5OV_07595 [Acidimicrobiales bacterium]
MRADQLAASAPALGLHQGQPLPVARVLVVMIPLAALAIYLWLRRRP